MSELLIELFSEEIPFLMQKKASKSYHDIFSKYFTQNKITCDLLHLFVGPRRITIHAKNMQYSVSEIINEIKGPKVTANPQAINGFCRSHNITISDLSVQNIKGIDYYLYIQKILPKNIQDILLSDLPTLISSHVWPKSMYWGNYDIKWVRPLHNILCLYDKQIIPFSYGHLIANNKSYGHRFLSPDVKIIDDYEDYSKKLRKHFVILDHIEKQQYITNEITKIASQLNLVVHQDELLVEEVASLVEYPVVMLGQINHKFLSVPSEILISAMKTHQKYFSLLDQNGNFAPYFIFVSNIKTDNPEIIISGNEKVLSARLEDALYFYHQDLNTRLSEKANQLKQVTFHAKIGTLFEKTLRLAKISNFISPNNQELHDAALLCKSDIVSQIVNEFPELQAIMGYYYALEEKLSQNIAIAIRDHYKPQGIADHTPSALSAILALADKTDTLCGLILIGEKPTGSKDPFALRRNALGIIRIILENRILINLTDLIQYSISEYLDHNLKIHISLKESQERKQQILYFLEERVKNFLKDQYSVELLNSVVDFNIDSNLVNIVQKLKSLQEFFLCEDGKNLLNLYKRINHIIGEYQITKDINISEFVSEYETNLYKTITISEEKIQKIFDSSEILSAKHLSDMLQTLHNMEAIIAKFFDNVMIKNNNDIILNNRMLLLIRVKNLFHRIAAFDKL